MVSHSPPSSQLQLAQFFKCYEGPFANTDGPTDFAKGASCVQAAGLPLRAIQECYDSIANSTTVNNPVQRVFWEQSQGVINYGFPYVEIDGAGPANWPDLLNIVCQKVSGRRPAGCGTQRLGLRLRLDWLGSGTASLSQLNVSALEKSVTQALSLIAANITYPVNFYAGGNVSDAYLLMNATLHTSATRLELDSKQGVVRVRAAATVYESYAKSTRQGLRTKQVVEYLRLALHQFGVTNFAPTTVRGLEADDDHTQVQPIDH